jgi:hypothetical protein
MDDERLNQILEDTMTLLGNQFPGLMDQLQHPPPLSLNIATSLAFDVSNSSSSSSSSEEQEIPTDTTTTLDIDISNGISSFEHVLNLKRYQLLETLSSNWYKHGREYHDVMYQMNTISQQLMHNIIMETRPSSTPAILYPTRSRSMDVRTFTYPSTATSILGRFVTDTNDTSSSSLYPNIRQILSATEVYPYHPETMSDRTCPITLEEFEEGEELCRIRSCRHVFTWKYLQVWFSTNSHCPVCRYDIRTYRPPTAANA